MANAVATVSMTDERNSFVAGDKYFVFGSVAVGASPLTYVTGGITMSFLVPLIKASRTPVYVRVMGQGAGAGGTLFIYVYVPGTDASNGLLKIFTSNGAAANGLAEFTNAAAIPADVSGDTITFEAIFTGQN